MRMQMMSSDPRHLLTMMHSNRPVLPLLSLPHLLFQNHLLRSLIVTTVNRSIIPASTLCRRMTTLTSTQALFRAFEVSLEAHKLAKICCVVVCVKVEPFLLSRSRL